MFNLQQQMTAGDIVKKGPLWVKLFLGGFWLIPLDLSKPTHLAFRDSLKPACELMKGGGGYHLPGIKVSNSISMGISEKKKTNKQTKRIKHA